MFSTHLPTTHAQIKHPKSVSCKRVHGLCVQSGQCCQVLPKFSGQPNEKIRPITEKIRPITEMIEKASSNHLLAYCNYLKGNFFFNSFLQKSKCGANYFVSCVIFLISAIKHLQKKISGPFSATFDKIRP